MADPGWGQVLAVGLGGIWVEVLAGAIVRLADLAERLGPALQPLEINPLWARGSQVEAHDAIAIWSGTPDGRPPDRDKE